MTTDHDLLSTETAGLAPVSRPRVIRLADGDRFALSIGPVRKDLSDDDPGVPGSRAELRMLAYNGSIPGPCPGTAHPSRTSCGRTPCCCGLVKRSTSCSMSATRDSGWRTVTSPNTTRAE